MMPLLFSKCSTSASGDSEGLLVRCVIKIILCLIIINYTLKKLFSEIELLHSKLIKTCCFNYHAKYKFDTIHLRVVLFFHLSDNLFRRAEEYG